MARRTATETATTATPKNARRTKRGPSGDSAGTREALLDAAQRDFESVGFDGTDTNRIARSAGYAPQTFYRHFPDKLAIFSAVYERWVDAQLGSSFAASTAAAAATAALEEHAATRVFRRDLRRLSVSDERMRAVRARQRQRQLELLRRNVPSARALPLAELASWLLCCERLADAIVDAELLDLGVSKPEAEAQFRQLIGSVLNPGAPIQPTHQHTGGRQGLAAADVAGWAPWPVARATFK